jgi:mRNA interferase RelE/StbE
VSVRPPRRSFQIRVTPAAARRLRLLPERYTTAVLELLPRIAENPRRLGKPLRFEPAGQWSARRGPYRVIYRIDEDPGLVFVLAAPHRADVYRRG